MEVIDHVRALDREGTRLADVADLAGLDAPVPTCPGWASRDLLAHLGGVHRWAESFVLTGRPGPATDDEVAGYFETPPADEIPSWFRTGHAGLVRSLAEADPQLTCWTFLAAPSPLAFWARRQAHETTIHRIDAESAAGTVTPVAVGLAADGIDELLSGFLGRTRGRLVADPPRSLGVLATDAGRAWSLHIEPDRRVVTPGVADGDCILRGTAGDLYSFLWNRRGLDGIGVQGDRSLVDLWQATVKITWT